MNVPVGRRHDAVQGCEPRARALSLFLRRVERLEDVLLCLWVDAVTGICDREARVLARRDARMEVDIAAAETLCPGLDRERAAGRHRVAGVHDEIDEHLLDLAPIGEDRR